MSKSELESRLYGVLSRNEQIQSLSLLIAAMKPEPTTFTLAQTAIGIDSSVFLRLGNNNKNADIIDYLSSRHDAPLILPGQAIQEFWNNHLNVVETLASGLKKKFNIFQDEVKKLGSEFEVFTQAVAKLLDEFQQEHGYVFDEGTVRKTFNALDTLKRRATVPYASRTAFDEICRMRKQTKTPPGFKDEGDGDFYIWLDFLFGLLINKNEGKQFSRVVLVTTDSKIDWSRNGVAHPILSAEVHALFAAGFEIWNIEKLTAEVAKALQEEAVAEEETIAEAQEITDDVMQEATNIQELDDTLESIGAAPMA